MAKQNTEFELYGAGLYFEDLPVGRRFRTAGRTITEADLVAFVNCTGLTGEMFTNIEFLKTQSAIKGRPVPGNLSYCLCEGFGVQGPTRNTGLALLEVDIKFLNPVFVGDTIYLQSEVIEARESRGRKNAGLVRFRNQVVKEDGTVVILYMPLRMMKRRNPGQ